MEWEREGGYLISPDSSKPDSLEQFERGIQFILRDVFEQTLSFQ